MSSFASSSELGDSLGDATMTGLPLEAQLETAVYEWMLENNSITSLPFGSDADFTMNSLPPPPISTPSLSFSDPDPTTPTIVFIILVKTPAKTFGPYHRQVQVTITYKAMMQEIEMTLEEDGGGNTIMCRFMTMMKEDVVEHVFDLSASEKDLQERWWAAICRLLDPVWGYRGEVTLMFE